MVSRYPNASDSWLGAVVCKWKGWFRLPTHALRYIGSGSCSHAASDQLPGSSGKFTFEGKVALQQPSHRTLLAWRNVGYAGVGHGSQGTMLVWALRARPPTKSCEFLVGAVSNV